MSAVESTAILAPNHQMVLQLATESQVHAFDLSEKFRVAVGRHHSNDIQLRSRRVSSYHAEILSEVEGLFIRDLESTNGTFVNDEAVRRKKLGSGDEIRIGGFTLTVRLMPRDPGNAEPESPREPFPAGTVGNLLPFRTAPPEHEFPDTTLPDLLNELSRVKRSGVVAIRVQHDEGRIYLEEGAVVHCEYRSVRRQKALYRLLGLERGTYQIQEPPSAAVPRTIEGTTEDLVVEGMQQLEALDKLAAKLPPMMYELALDETCGLAVNGLRADELEIYRDLVRYPTIARLLDESEKTDFMVLLLIHGLLQKGFFRQTKTPGAILEETMLNRS
jgi:hypothetical protein